MKNKNSLRPKKMSRITSFEFRKKMRNRLYTNILALDHPNVVLDEQNIKAINTVCFCCRRTPISFDDFEAGHVIPYYCTPNPQDFENMHAICHTCNHLMKGMHMYLYMLMNQYSVFHLSEKQIKEGYSELKKYIPTLKVGTKNYHRAKKVLLHYFCEK